MVNKEWVELHGTSASTPVFAGMLAMIADARAVAGKAPLPGHVTPLLYHLAALQPGIFTSPTWCRYSLICVYLSLPSALSLSLAQRGEF